MSRPLADVFPLMDGKILGATLFGSQAHLVRAETRTGRGLSRVILVGMPDAVAREARERLPSAFEQFDLPFPKGKVLFNLVPAQMPKCGLPLDLALAVSLLVEEGLVPRPKKAILFLAELDLKGRLGPPARGTLLAALAAIQEGCMTLITAPSAATEAALAPGVEAFGLEDLGEVVAYLKEPGSFRPMEAGKDAGQASERLDKLPRMDDLRGQPHARRAATLALAGRHALWMQGPPGTGKSMLARRLAHLLPDLAPERALEVGMIEALLRPLAGLSLRPPFRAPHTSASAQALLGGGTPLRPGEIARAHGGILFLDEIPEFARPVLEGLRQPLEEGEVRLQRAREWATYPAQVQLVATSNPCPCGYATHPKMPCRCTPHKRQAYAQRVSGPLRDRFDLFVEMGPVEAEALDGPVTGPTDEALRQQLRQTRAFQEAQAVQRGFRLSSEASVEVLQQAGIAVEARRMLRQAVNTLPLSGRGLLRCLRVARTAADLDRSPGIRVEDVRMALSYRPLPAEEEATIRPLRLTPRATPPQPPKDASHSPRGSAN
ncbi:MAG: YifB family Mg chelatase-like AAA ATPase [Planctomycetota bacterium]